MTRTIEYGVSTGLISRPAAVVPAVRRKSGLPFGYRYAGPHWRDIGARVGICGIWANMIYHKRHRSSHYADVLAAVVQLGLPRSRRAKGAV